MAQSVTRLCYGLDGRGIRIPVGASTFLCDFRLPPRCDIFAVLGSYAEYFVADIPIQTGCPELSATSYQSTLRNTREQWRPQEIFIFFSKTSRPVLGYEVKRPGREVVHSPPSSAEWSHTSYHSIWLHGVDTETFRKSPLCTTSRFQNSLQRRQKKHRIKNICIFFESEVLSRLTWKISRFRKNYAVFVPSWCSTSHFKQSTSLTEFLASVPVPRE